ncbi:hypothetical protein JNG60_02555 [Mycoplasmopsis bovis]|uniref:hypothetical protein n=1 Tax=Mycoplasmopsis bovis TaxID=28903 RepID=UPI001CF281F7|nr:hypothetical protein [Mycoplasmopsis bovis]UCP02232.1 hypothetical protein JNG59_02555 [Mycoplasmopsis bovis]UCP03080.1 hypothetical protein JNG60_02555 [Mycoplasmopsis bovis]
MKSKIYIIMFSCFMLKLGNVGDYVNDGGLIYKTRDIASSYNKKRINGHFRRQIISFSQKRATKPTFPT